MKYSFKNDYSEGAHPKILEELQQVNFLQKKGYGEDPFCTEAAEHIRRHIQQPHADVHFVSGGTQTNAVVISAMLKSYESVIAAEVSHIAVHETGAIEATGHKIHTVPSQNGKIYPIEIEKVLTNHATEHMLRPKLVFISNSTEMGGVYTAKELEVLSECCKKNDLYLYLDGARLGSALTSKANDYTLADIAKWVDAFYIGGTKNGALLGEAIVFLNPDVQPYFRYHLKQKGALLAKSWLIGLQFLVLFRDDLYFELATHANTMAQKLSIGLQAKNVSFRSEVESNQVFPIVSNQHIERLQKAYDFHIWEKTSETESVIRLVTSWATPEEKIKKFLQQW